MTTALPGDLPDAAVRPEAGTDRALAAGVLPFVSVIVPVYNDNSRLQTCLDALARQTYPQHRFEVIVVDNGSDVPVSQVIKKTPNVTILEEPLPGSFAARNTGLAAAQGDVMAFTDADCFAERTWLDEAVKALGDGRRIVAGHVQVIPCDPGHPTAVERYEMLWGYEQRIFARHGESATANLIAQRTAFEEAGAFQTDSYSGHDFEWCHGAVRLGYKVVYAPNAVVRTPARATFAELSVKFRRFAGANFTRGRKRNTLWANRRWALLTVVKPPLRRLREAVTRPDAGSWGHRAHLCGILMALPIVYAIEWVRMEAGFGQAERR